MISKKDLYSLWQDKDELIKNDPIIAIFFDLLQNKYPYCLEEFKKCTISEDISDVVLETSKKILELINLSDELSIFLSYSNVDQQLVIDLIALSKLTDTKKFKNEYEEFLNHLHCTNPLLASNIRSQTQMMTHTDINALLRATLVLLSDVNMYRIANTSSPAALRLISAMVDINQFVLSNEYANNPILMAISKGYNHINDNCPQNTIYDPNSSRDSYYQQVITLSDSTDHNQKEIIDALLNREDIDVTVKHRTNGMTPLHIACLRGDSPALIKKLLEKGADIEALDNEGRTPLDMLKLSYSQTIDLIAKLTGCIPSDFQKGANRTTSYTATLPTEVTRQTNQYKINNLLLCAQDASLQNKQIKLPYN